MVALDKPSALLAEHMSALLPPAALQRPPGSPVCTHELGLTPKFEQNSFSNNQPAKYAGFLPLSAKALKYIHTRVMGMALDGFCLCSFLGVV